MAIDAFMVVAMHRVTWVLTRMDIRHTLAKIDTPSDWGCRQIGNLDPDPPMTAAVILAQFDRAGTDDVITVYDNSGMADDGRDEHYGIEWHTDDGVAHIHTAETLEELRGVVSAMIYMVNHYPKTDDSSNSDGSDDSDDRLPPSEVPRPL